MSEPSDTPREYPRATIGITGAGGFIGSYLLRRLSHDSHLRMTTCARECFSEPKRLREFVARCDTIVHLAAMDRGHERTIYDTNVGLVDQLIAAFEATGSTPRVVYASSTERDRATAYGSAKKECERRLREWAESGGGRLTILVIPEVFGPGCRPYHNSIVATFCDQLAHEQEPVVIDEHDLTLVSIHELIEAMCQMVADERGGVREARVPAAARLRVTQLLEKLQHFRACYFEDQIVPNLSDPFDANLYTTFLSHVEIKNHLYRPKMYIDPRGELCEIMKMVGGGQMFFSTTRPGIVRGNHYHTRKIEWLCVVRGDAVIRLRRVGDARWREFRVSGREPQFITIPPLYMHQIENVGDEDMLTMFWCNEIFASGNADTFHDEPPGDAASRAA